MHIIYYHKNDYLKRECAITLHTFIYTSSFLDYGVLYLCDITSSDVYIYYIKFQTNGWVFTWWYIHYSCTICKITANMYDDWKNAMYVFRSEMLHIMCLMVNSNI